MSELKLLQPQEIDVYYLLPAIRRELTLALKKQGFDQKTIAKRLHVTESAVSQYVSSKRAAEVVFTARILEYIRTASTMVVDDKSLMIEMQKILAFSHEDKIICKLHEKLSKLPINCDVCFHHEKDN